MVYLQDRLNWNGWQIWNNCSQLLWNGSWFCDVSNDEAGQTRKCKNGFVSIPALGTLKIEEDREIAEAPQAIAKRLQNRFAFLREPAKDQNSFCAN